MSNDPFGAPASSIGIDWKALKGALLLVKVSEVIEHLPTAHTKPGEKSPAVRADVVVLDDKGDVEAETAYVDTLIFPKVLQSQVKGSVGGMVLGRLGQGAAKPAQSPPWTLAEATEADKVIGREYLAKVSTAPF